MKIDVIGAISETCDARNISTRDRVFVASSVANALGVDINKTTAWRKGQETRIQRSKEINNKFICPERVVVHWDGKTLMLRGRLESKRVCV